MFVFRSHGVVYHGSTFVDPIGACRHHQCLPAPPPHLQRAAAHWYRLAAEAGGMEPVGEYVLVGGTPPPGGLVGSTGLHQFYQAWFMDEG